MKQWWLLGTCVLALSACGGGGDDGSERQTPFQALVSQFRSTPVLTDCLSMPSYSNLETTEIRVSASGDTIEAFERDAFFSSGDCTGETLVQGRLLAEGAEVIGVRIRYESTVNDIQVRLLDGRTFNTTVDRVTFNVNPQSGFYDFDFIGVPGTQEVTADLTEANFTINDTPIRFGVGNEASRTVSAGLAFIEGELFSLIPEGDSLFVETDDL